METFDYDVLISGLGPVGATLAGLLGQRGVRVLVIDRDAAPHPLPRAVHFDHEIMRVFQGLGVAEAILAHTRQLPAYEFRAANGDLLIDLHPQAETPSGWASGFMFHQPGLEAVLRDALASMPSVDVRLGWRLTGFEQTSAAVTASIATPDGERSVRARFIVGCDGASSLVRETIGGGLFSYDFDEPWLVIDAKLTPESRTPKINLQLCDPARPTTCVLSGPDRHRWEFMLLPGDSLENITSDESINTLLEPWNCGPLEIERKAIYRFHGLVANRWRAGRAFIAGDAAHQTPPFAGQGMCAGVRDAVNLAWKLAAVLDGRAGEALLDTYQTEREPHARAVIELAIAMGRVVCMLDPEAAAGRDAHMLALRQSGASPLPPSAPPPIASDCILADCPGAGAPLPQAVAEAGVGRHARLDDALGPDAWLLTRTAFDHDAAGLRVAQLDAPALAPFRPALEAWLAAREADAVLVRPDRYVFGVGAPAALAATWFERLSGLGKAA